ncbi:MAG TPA: metalloregulator ArsR/SmtB family transcription factor [Candidatus Paceibacterota bacterium]|nr:metalloregulator ArsR/SmtB family transcription factor [Candidatus Paceibacterota bacterium]
MTDLCKEIAEMGKGIGNENRYKILEILMNGPCTVGQVAEKVRLAQPAVSQNLKVLKTAKLVTDKRRGQEVYYSVNVAYMAKLLKQLAGDVEKCKNIK